MNKTVMLYRVALCLLLIALALVAGVCRLRWEQQQWRIEELQDRLHAQAETFAQEQQSAKRKPLAP